VAEMHIFLSEVHLSPAAYPAFYMYGG